jgi:hypothetical protein
MTGPAQPTLWIVSPLYLDVESYLQLRQELRELLAGSPEVAGPRFVVVDDSAGSDAQVRALADLPDVTVVTPPFNLGHQRAIVYGLRMLEPRIADQDVVVTMDADGEDRPADIPRLMEALLRDPGNRRKIVLARRTQRHVSWAFKTLYFFFKLLFQGLTGLVVRTGNYAAYRGWAVRQVLPHPHFDLCYSSSLISLNLDASYVPCARGRRYAGESRMGYLKLIRHGISMLMPFLDRIAVRALLTFSATLALGLGLWMALALVSARSVAVPAWALGSALAVSVVSFVALGNLIVLFAIYAQSQSVALSRLDRAGSPKAVEPAPADRLPG